MASKKSLLQEELGRVDYKDQSNNAKSSLRFAFALTLASLTLTLATIGVLLYRNNYIHLAVAEPLVEQTILADGPMACVPCLMLLRDLSRDAAQDPLVGKLSRKTENGSEICCAYTSDQMSVMFEAVCEFKAEDDRVFKVEHHRGVKVRKTSLEILHGGLYYVYASFQFRPQSLRPCREFKYKTFAAYVMRVATNQWYESDTLLKATYTCCDACINNQETRFVGGLFILNPGDNIQVKVMGFELIYFNAYSSFAGLAMLGSIPQSVLNNQSMAK
ncbi:hypothetical protein PoB_001205700 [Plakobranchus ocellatus]|uniref:THD domain-containing protein n=1 Tax=Plakobranchus ocellatus TaxID=259542 RepID=A0AAV3YTU9_9GAST|nr:hypothetical protein PoB_001205700 [Plakobranchus ocellatus]